MVETVEKLHPYSVLNIVNQIENIAKNLSSRTQSYTIPSNELQYVQEEASSTKSFLVLDKLVLDKRIFYKKTTEHTSVGVQDTAPLVNKVLKEVHSLKDATSVYDTLQRFSVNGITTDLFSISPPSKHPIKWSEYTGMHLLKKVDSAVENKIRIYKNSGNEVLLRMFNRDYTELVDDHRLLLEDFIVKLSSAFRTTKLKVYALLPYLSVTSVMIYDNVTLFQLLEGETAFSNAIRNELFRESKHFIKLGTLFPMMIVIEIKSPYLDRTDILILTFGTTFLGKYNIGKYSTNSRTRYGFYSNEADIKPILSELEAGIYNEVPPMYGTSASISDVITRVIQVPSYNATSCNLHTVPII